MMLISDNACFGGAGLEALEARVKHELELLSYPGRDWVIPRTAPDGSEALNVLVIGGGQGGVAVAAKLGLERVRGVRVVDANPAGQAGPWVTFARMITLRTPKRRAASSVGRVTARRLLKVPTTRSSCSSA